MIVRKDYLRASDIMRQRVAANEKITVLYEHNTVGLYGEDGVEGAHLVKRLGQPDEERVDLPIDGFFLAIGHHPNSELFADYVEVDEVGYIKTEGLRHAPASLASSPLATSQIPSTSGGHRSGLRL